MKCKLLFIATRHEEDEKKKTQRIHAHKHSMFDIVIEANTQEQRWMRTYSFRLTKAFECDFDAKQISYEKSNETWASRNTYWIRTMRCTHTLMVKHPKRKQHTPTSETSNLKAEEKKKKFTDILHMCWWWWWFSCASSYCYYNFPKVKRSKVLILFVRD